MHGGHGSSEVVVEAMRGDGRIHGTKGTTKNQQCLRSWEEQVGEKRTEV